MKLKNMYTLCAAVFLLFGTTACDDKLEIIPKGKTTLATVADLELLLNQEWALAEEPCNDISIICNESLGMNYTVPEDITMPNTLGRVYLAFDESIDRAMITMEDGRYNAVYKYINYMNVILEKIDDASGDAARKPALKAEARIFRAYFHWLLVNIHAQQYDATTAAEKGGIAYVDETDVSKQKTKLTLEETYQRILEDCADEYIELLPEKAPDTFRAGKAFGYAVRAKVLMQMKQYADALPYAQKALNLNGRIEDRSVIKESGSWELTPESPHVYVYIRGGTRFGFTQETLTPETTALFASDDYVLKYEALGWSYEYAQMITGVENCMIYFGSARGNCFGINSEHMYYVAAECLIRTGSIREGLEMADRVRAKHIENYEPFAAKYDAQTLSEEEAMALMQKAKWIACIGSYDNFFDTKRWNTEAKYKRTITRNLGELGTYTITPESPLWVFPFPANAVRYNPSLTQNY